ARLGGRADDGHGGAVHQAGAPDPDGRRGAGAADRVRQRVEPRAVALRGAAAGVRAADGARRGARTHRAAGADGEHGAGARGGRAGRGDRRGGRAAPGSTSKGRAADRGQPREHAGAAVRAGRVAAHLTAAMVRLPSAKYPSVGQARVTLDQLLAKVRAIPGVQSATLGSDLPICCQGQSTISFASRPEADQGKLAVLNVAVVDPEYFETLQIPFVGGRHIETGDRAGAPLVALVSERVAKKFFAGASPIGERLRLGGGGQVNNTSSWRTIVGVVRDTRT